MALFWPEGGEDEGRRALRQALYYLRQFTGDGVLVSRPDETVAVAEGRLWCDAVAFEAALAAGRAADALELYRGDFLAGGLASEVSPDFELWADQVRRRLRGARGPGPLGDRRSGGGGRPLGLPRSTPRAAPASLSPDDEPGARRLIALLDRLGDRAGALRVHQELVDRLAREFAAEPSAETRAIGDALRSPSPAVAGRASRAAARVRARSRRSRPRPCPRPFRRCRDGARRPWMRVGRGGGPGGFGVCRLRAPSARPPAPRCSRAGA